MRTAWFWIGLILLLALPDATAAQHQRREASRGLNGAVEKLLEHREQLGMTADQLTRVQEIKDTADARKQPFWRQIMTVRRELKARQKAQPEMPEAEKAAMVEQGGEQIHRLLDEIRSIDHAAMREVSRVLRPEQKEILMELVTKKRGGRDRSGSPPEREDRRH